MAELEVTPKIPVSRAWVSTCLLNMNVTQYDCHGKTEVKWKYFNNHQEDISKFTNLQFTCQEHKFLWVGGAIFFLPWNIKGGRKRIGKLIGNIN